MGTRGVYGFWIDGRPKLMYNNYSSAEYDLGSDLLVELKQWLEPEKRGKWDKLLEVVTGTSSYRNRVNELKDAARAMTPIFEQSPPGLLDEIRWREYTDPYLYDRDKDWYGLTRRAQGSISPFLEVGYYLERNEFALDGRICEYGYIINLDTEEYEVYTNGKRNEKPKFGHFTHIPTDDPDFHPIGRVAKYPFTDLPTHEVLCEYMLQLHLYRKRDDPDYHDPDYKYIRKHGIDKWA